MFEGMHGGGRGIGEGGQQNEGVVRLEGRIVAVLEYLVIPCMDSFSWRSLSARDIPYSNLSLVVQKQSRPNER